MNKYTLIYNQYKEEEGDMPGEGCYTLEIAQIQCKNIGQFLNDNAKYHDTRYLIKGWPVIMGEVKIFVIRHNSL